MKEDLYSCFCICAACVKDEYLKKYIVNTATQDDNCTVCLQNKKVINIYTDSNFKNFSRFLIRYYYPEYEYNYHWGGDELPSQFFQENPILSHDFADREDIEIIMDDFFHIMFDLWEDNSSVDIYYGHDEGGRGLFANSIKEEKSLIWQNYKKALQTKNFYLLEEDAKEYFTKVLFELRLDIQIETVFSRARIGYKEITKKINSSEVKVKEAFSKKDLSAPPIFKSSAGRANRQGVSYLYLASTKETAIGEIRPHPGHYVSVGKFKNNETINVVDLRFINLMNYYRYPEELELFKFLRDISEELSIPILPEEKENYLVTQFISDIIRQIGFDGILFNSSLSDGYNLVAFNNDKFSFISSSQSLIKIKKVEFKYKPIIYMIDSFMENVKES